MHRRQFLKAATVNAAMLALPLSARRAFAADLPSDITAFTARDLSTAIHNGAVSCVEVMQAYLARIDQVNPIYNAIVGRVANDDLLRQARAADQELARDNSRGWMHGMPHAVKDLASVRGLVYTSGSPMFADRIATEDSSFVARLRDNGAIFIGKTNSPEFGLGSQTYNAVFGPTGSACNPALTAGGSSGGAASGLGTQMLPVADGSDMMGSLRNPGAFNNVIGFRPTAGLMNDTPPDSIPLSTGGPMGRNTADTIALLNIMAPRPLAGEFAALDMAGLDIAWLGDIDGYLAMESGILPLCERNLRTIESQGASVTATLPQFDMDELWFCWTTLRHAGRARMMDYYENPETRALLKPELVWEIEQSMTFTAQDIARAEAIRTRWLAELERLFGDYDFLTIPTAQVFPYSKQAHWPRFIGARPMDTYHRWMEVVILGSLGGLPVINVPVGFDASGRPMGMQVMGRRGDDRRVLEFGLAYEAQTDYLGQHLERIQTV
ncbi:MAG: amidase [Pseudohongiellaceae bacterium]